jgi:flavin-binding protein dodecin
LTAFQVIELVGVSTHGWQQAAENALAEAAGVREGLTAAEVVGWTADVSDNGEVLQYQATVRARFRIGD